MAPPAVRVTPMTPLGRGQDRALRRLHPQAGRLLDGGHGAGGQQLDGVVELRRTGNGVRLTCSHLRQRAAQSAPKPAASQNSSR